MNIKKVQPVEDKIFVEIIEDSEGKTGGGIYLPEDADKGKPILGKVLAIGDSELIKVKKGDYVLFAKFSGTEVEYQQKDCLILTSVDILAKVTL